MSLRSHSHALGRVCLALLMVSSVVIGTTGTAAAETVSTDCGLDDAIRGFHSVIDPEVDCGVYDDSAEDQTRLDAYASAQAMEQSRETYYTTRNNLQQDLRGILWLKAQVATAEALNNGANKSEAKSAFDDSVENYTTRLIRNDLRRHEAAMVQMAYLSNQTGGTATSPGHNVDAYSSLASATYRLPDGSNITVNTTVAQGGDMALFTAEGRDRYGIVAPFEPEDGKIYLLEHSWSEGTEDDNAAHEALYVGPESYDGASNDGGVAPYSDENTSKEEFVPAISMADVADQTESWMLLADDIKANGAQWIDGFYSEYQAGDISTSDIVGPAALAQEASTDYNETGYYSFANAELAAIGLTGQQNVSHVVQTDLTVREYDSGNDTGAGASYSETTYNAEIEGTLFLSGGDLSIVTGNEYDPDNLNGAVYMTVASAEDTDTGEPIEGMDKMVQIKEPFTVTEATNTQTGESVSVTSAENKDYSTSNLTEFKNELERLKSQRKALEEERANLIIDGGGGDGQQTQGGLLDGLLPSGVTDWFETATRGALIGLIALAVVGIWLLGQIFGGGR
ncbi:hypothetical protein [Haloarcula laminariae]|uniref:hypothetical protein n=1 Tax=Haloarcula laminariae TaxID=2961577 RepID=UPI0021C9CCE3|nr:hypothetical protein [Halomicroarcula laminariae]